jgi:uncharacterized damage-inducible protein DinB
MRLATLIEQYASGHNLIQEAVAGMSDAQIRARPIPGKWNTLEVVSHLADFEIVGLDRLSAVIAEVDPILPGRNEQLYAARLAYEQRDLTEQLQLIGLCRSHATRILRTLTNADLSRRGIHSEAGPLTLDQLLVRVINHVQHHVPFIHEKRKAMA